jgi:hypothetical protein
MRLWPSSIPETGNLPAVIQAGTKAIVKRHPRATKGKGRQRVTRIGQTAATMAIDRSSQPSDAP